MNKSLLASTVSKVLWLEALLMLCPTLVSIHYQEEWIYTRSYLLTIVILLLLGGVGSYFFKSDQSVYAEADGFAITSLSWLLMSIFGALPLYLSGDIPSFIDGVFEMMSGFTTTGASILADVEALQQSSLFWRSFSHLIGGMGILVFFFAFAPQMGQGSHFILKAEMPGPQFGKLQSKNKDSASLLYVMYLFLTLILFLLLMAVGLKPFDAAIHAFGSAGTGGFSNRALSLGYFNNPAAEYITAVAMLIFGVNFNLYYLLLKKQAKKVWKDDELKAYLLIIVLSVGLIMFNLKGYYAQLEGLFRDSLFTVSTIMTTTGYATRDFNRWPLFSQLILLALMFIGGMAGSTAGGMKVSRIVIYVKSIFKSLLQAVHPRQLLVVFNNQKAMDQRLISQAYAYLAFYILIFFTCLLLVSASQDHFMTAFSAVAACMNNIGPGLAGVGPRSSFADFSPFAKLALTLAMLVGRLEIYPVMALFLPSVWKKR